MMAASAAAPVEDVRMTCLGPMGTVIKNNDLRITFPLWIGTFLEVRKLANFSLKRCPRLTMGRFCSVGSRSGASYKYSSVQASIRVI